MSQSVPDGAELPFSVTSYLRHLHDEKYFGKGKTGKMKVKELIGQGKGAEKVELDGGGIRDFDKLAKKYGVDYAVVKDKETGHYKVFFKAQDAAAINDLVADYTKKQMTMGARKASVLDKIKKFKEVVTSIPRKVAEKIKEQAR